MRFHFRYPLNVAGEYYIDDLCVFCGYCRNVAPANFSEDLETGFYYVSKQPSEIGEFETVNDALEMCPTGAIRRDGNLYNWKLEPIMNWNRYFSDLGVEVSFDLGENILDHAQFMENGKYRHQWHSAD